MRFKKFPDLLFDNLAQASIAYWGVFAVDQPPEKNRVNKKLYFS